MGVFGTQCILTYTTRGTNLNRFCTHRRTHRMSSLLYRLEVPRFSKVRPDHAALCAALDALSAVSARTAPNHFHWQALTHTHTITVLYYRLWLPTSLLAALVISSVYCYSAPVWKWSIAISLSVCLSVCPRAYLWNRWTDLNGICYANSLWRDSVFLWRRCDTLCTSGFMDDVTFRRNGPYGDAWLAALRYRGKVRCLWIPSSCMMDARMTYFCAFVMR